MKARDLVTPYPTVRLDADAVEAARLLTEHGRPGLVVVDDNHHPIAVLPGSQVLLFVIPAYIQDDPTLARVVDEEFTEQACEALRGKSVKDLLPTEKSRLQVVEPDDNLLEIAAQMVATHSPIVAVVDGPGKTAPMVGAISLVQLLGGLLPRSITDPG